MESVCPGNVLIGYGILSWRVKKINFGSQGKINLCRISATSCLRLAVGCICIPLYNENLSNMILSDLNIWSF